MLLASTRRPTRSTTVSVNYSFLDAEDFDDNPMDFEGSDEKPKRKARKPKLNTKMDFDSEVFTNSANDQSDSSATPSELDMSSDQTSPPGQFESGTSHPDVEQPSPKRRKTKHGRGHTAAKSAPENDALVDSAQDTSLEKKSESSPTRTSMKKEVDLTLPSLWGVGDG
jgi:hypothetical protein